MQAVTVVVVQIVWGVPPMSDGDVNICMVCGNPLVNCTCTVAVSQVDYEPVAVNCFRCNRPAALVMEQGSVLEGNWVCERCIYKEDKQRQEVYEDIVNGD